MRRRMPAPQGENKTRVGSVVRGGEYETANCTTRGPAGKKKGVFVKIEVKNGAERGGEAGKGSAVKT